MGPTARRVLLVALAILSVAAGASAREHTSRGLASWAPGWFRIARAEVLGAESIPAQELRGVLEPALGRGPAEIDPARIEAQLRRHPRVAHARVSDALPGRLLVQVVVRRPMARVADPGGAGEWWVDSTGTPFAPSAEEGSGARSLPLLVAPGAVALGVRSAELASAVGSILQLRAAGLAVAEWQLVGDGAGDPTPRVRLRGAIPPILLGDGDRGVQLPALIRALAVSPLRDAGAIDLRFRDQVILWPDAPGVGGSGKRAPPEG